jgi:hypothetical protein
MIRRLWFVVIPLLAMTSQVQAEPAELDKFRLAIGGYALARYDSSISLTDPDLGAGISISPQDTLGIDIENTVLRIEGYYRFHPKHALLFSWYSINSTGSKIIEEEFDWEDDDGNTVTVPVGAQVFSILDYEIFKLGYLWSFHHTDKIELGVGAGLHFTSLSMELDASSTTPPSQSLQDAKTTVPLPVFSLVLKYNVTPKFHWYLKSEAFLLKFDNWTGSYRDTTLGMEYRAWKNVALGAGLSSNSLEIEEDDPDHILNFTNSISGGLLYVATYF